MGRKKSVEFFDVAIIQLLSELGKAVAQRVLAIRLQRLTVVVRVLSPTLQTTEKQPFVNIAVVLGHELGFSVSVIHDCHCGNIN